MKQNPSSHPWSWEDRTLYGCHRKLRSFLMRSWISKQLWREKRENPKGCFLKEKDKNILPAWLCLTPQLVPAFPESQLDEEGKQGSALRLTGQEKTLSPLPPLSFLNIYQLPSTNVLFLSFLFIFHCIWPWFSIVPTQGILSNSFLATNWKFSFFPWVKVSRKD